MPRRPTNEPHFKRARLPLPVTRAEHWRLVCACGVELNACRCPVKDEDVHVEVWRDGCSFVAKWYSPAPAPTGITPRTPAHASWVTLRPALRTRDPVVSAPPPSTQPALPPAPAPPAVRQSGRKRIPLDETALAVRWQSGETVSAIARDLEVSHDTLYNRMKALGITRPPTSTLAQHGDALRAMTAQGLSQAAMALRLGVSATLVCRALKALGIGGWRRGPRGRA